MLLFIESVIVCIIFNLGIMVPLAKNPVGQIMSYPAPIRKRVESLPQYKDCIQTKEKKHLSIKIIFILLLILIMTAVAYFSGARDFQSAFFHNFILFMVVNLYDLFVMDLGFFMHCKKFWIPGTEDMVREYHDPTHHVVGAGVGTLIGLVVALGSAGIIQLITMI